MIIDRISYKMSDTVINKLNPKEVSWPSVELSASIDPEDDFATCKDHVRALVKKLMHEFCTEIEARFVNRSR